MTKKILFLVFLFSLLNGYANRSEAALMYDNGPSAWSGASGFGYGTTDVLADDFTLSVAGTIKSADLDLWVDSGADPKDTDLDWWLFNNTSGDPGNVISSGSGINLSSVYVGEHVVDENVKFWTLYFDLDKSVQLEVGTIYWFGLHLSDGSWSNSLRKGYNDARSENGTFDNWVHTSSTTFDTSFRLNGDPIPEPATLILFGTGLVGIAGMRLRRMINLKYDNNGIISLSMQRLGVFNGLACDQLLPKR